MLNGKTDKDSKQENSEAKRAFFFALRRTNLRPKAPMSSQRPTRTSHAPRPKTGPETQTNPTSVHTPRRSCKGTING
jgi:hypothetical protein